VPIRFSEREHWEEGLAGLRHTLDLFEAAGAAGARPVLCDAGGPERIANPGRGGEDASLRLDDARWRTLVEGVERAAEAARERGFVPVFHHHTSTYVEGVVEIERLLEDSDVALLLDSGHIAVAGGDAVEALADWGERIGAVHIKDVRLDVLERVKTERADTLTAWRRGLFCGLGQGDADVERFCAALADRGYDGWVVVEQDRVLEDGAAFAAASAEQTRNRDWLREHAGW
jgi:inosose dehydratase